MTTIIDQRSGNNLADSLSWLFEGAKGATVKELLIRLLNSGWKHIEGTKDFMILQKDIEGENPRAMSALLDFYRGDAYFFNSETSSVPALAIYTTGSTLTNDMIECLEQFERGEIVAGN